MQSDEVSERSRSVVAPMQSDEMSKRSRSVVAPMQSDKMSERSRSVAEPPDRCASVISLSILLNLARDAERRGERAVP